MRRVLFLFLIPFIFWPLRAVWSIDSAEEEASGREEGEKREFVRERARFRLNHREALFRGGERPVTEEDFSWERLVRDGALAGEDPVIGDKNKKPYFDFKDGHPYPYYVASEMAIRRNASKP